MHGGHQVSLLRGQRLHLRLALPHFVGHPSIRSSTRWRPSSSAVEIDRISDPSPACWVVQLRPPSFIAVPTATARHGQARGQKQVAAAGARGAGYRMVCRYWRVARSSTYTRRRVAVFLHCCFVRTWKAGPKSVVFCGSGKASCVCIVWSGGVVLVAVESRAVVCK